MPALSNVFLLCFYPFVIIGIVSLKEVFVNANFQYSERLIRALIMFDGKNDIMTR